LVKQVSLFAAPRGAAEPAAPGPETDDQPMPDLDDPRMMRVMTELERDSEHMDENNPKHMAHFMRKMKDALPPGVMPKAFDTAIKRLEGGDDPEKIDADMGHLLGDFPGEPEDEGGLGGYGGGGGYSRDPGMYEY
jgi:hypothetical protein